MNSYAWTIIGLFGGDVVSSLQWQCQATDPNGNVATIFNNLEVDPVTGSLPRDANFEPALIAFVQNSVDVTGIQAQLDASLASVTS